MTAAVAVVLTQLWIGTSTFSMQAYPHKQVLCMNNSGRMFIDGSSINLRSLVSSITVLRMLGGWVAGSWI